MVDTAMVIRASDGSVVRQWDSAADSGMMRFDNEYILSVLADYRPLRIWTHPKTEEIRLSVLDQSKKILYQLGYAENQTLTCLGCYYIELEDQPVHAIYVDCKKKRLLTCDDRRISDYDLESGKKIKVEFEFPSEEDSILEAAFAPGGQTLEVTTMSCFIDEMRMLRQQVFFAIDYTNDSYYMRPNADDEGEILRYDFLIEDIESGIDSGKRVPVFDNGYEWVKEEIESDDLELLCPEKILFDHLPRFLWPKRLKKFYAERIDIKHQLFDCGSGYCSISRDGYYFWDDTTKREFKFLGEPDELKALKDKNNRTKEIYPFGDGFLDVNKNYLIYYVKNLKNSTMERFVWKPWGEYFALGCPGTEEIQEFRKYNPFGINEDF